MKNSSLKTRANSRHSSKKVFLGVLALVVVAVGFVYFFGKPIGTLNALISTPIYSVRNWFAESGSFLPAYIRSRNELTNEINSLNDELAARRGTDSIIERMIRENEELRALLNVYEEDRIVAAVSARPPFIPYDSVLIDRGSADGIKENAVVYHANNQAIGFVSKAFEHSALVTLFSTAGVSATAYILGPDVYATIYGDGGGVLRVSVPQGIKLSIGDVVIAPSLEGGVLGTIEDIESSPTQPTQQGYVVSDIPMQSLRLVSVSPRPIETITYAEAETIVKEKVKQLEELTVEVPEGVGSEATSTTEEDQSGT